MDIVTLVARARDCSFGTVDFDCACTCLLIFCGFCTACACMSGPTDSFACSSSAYGCQFFLPMLEFGFELLSGLGGSCHQILWLNFFLTFKDTHKCLSHSKPSTASERLYSHSL